jgi:hypothetical protein
MEAKSLFDLCGVVVGRLESEADIHADHGELQAIYRKIDYIFWQRRARWWGAKI